jgi:hypothetical protein
MSEYHQCECPFHDDGDRFIGAATVPTKAGSRPRATAGSAPSATTSLKRLGGTDWSTGTSWSSLTVTATQLPKLLDRNTG